MGGGSSRVKVPPPNFSPPAPASTNSPGRGHPVKTLGRKYSKKFSHISDDYKTLEQVQVALRHAGLESSNLILGVDFTKSNEWTGKHSFRGRSLHAIGDQPNPYEQAISIIGQTLSPFDDDDEIPCFGFGDASTHDQYVFSFYQGNRPCQGFSEALTRYRQIVPNLKLAGPTSFAPIVEAAVKTVQESGGQYHVLVIIADGQVTRSVDTSPGNLSPQERSTIDAIVAASDYPLSIILVGVGDGPWDMMREFDDNIPARAFDNFQFVNFSEIMARNLAGPQKEAMFALAALMEIPGQYKATMELALLNKPTERTRSRDPLPPPQAVLQADMHVYGLGHMGSFAHTNSFAPTSSQGGKPQYPPAGYYKDSPEDSRQGSHQYPPKGYSQSSASSKDIDDGSQQVCPVCMTERKDLAFGCGHQTCRDCGKDLQNCPICREFITTRIRLY